MGHWPTRLGYARVSVPRGTLSVTFALDSKTVTASATAHTKGAWTELVTSTPFDVQEITLFIGRTMLSATNTGMLLDLGIGAAGSEMVIVPNIGCGFLRDASNEHITRYWRIPVSIPSGSRIAARIQATVVSDTALVAIADMYGGPPPGGFLSGAAVDTYGANEADSKGVLLTAGAVAGTKGTWTEIEDSIPNPIKGIFVSPQGADNALNTTGQFTDIGVGALTQETVIVPDIPTITTASEELKCMNPGWFPLDTPIPAGSRIVARIASTSALEQKVNYIVHGIR